MGPEKAAVWFGFKIITCCVDDVGGAGVAMRGGSGGDPAERERAGSTQDGSSGTGGTVMRFKAEAKKKKKKITLNIWIIFTETVSYECCCFKPLRLGLICYIGVININHQVFVVPLSKYEVESQ